MAVLSPDLPDCNVVCMSSWTLVPIRPAGNKLFNILWVLVFKSILEGVQLSLFKGQSIIELEITRPIQRENCPLIEHFAYPISDHGITTLADCILPLVKFHYAWPVASASVPQWLALFGCTLVCSCKKCSAESAAMHPAQNLWNETSSHVCAVYFYL